MRCVFVVLFALGLERKRKDNNAMTQIVTSHDRPAWVGAAWIVSAGAVFAIINILVQYATMVLGQAPGTVAFWQYFIALLFSLPWVFTRLRSALSTRQLPLHLLRVFFAAAGVQFWVLGLSSVPIWQAIALLMTSPFFVTLGAGLILGERVTPDRWLAVLVGFVGGMIILAPWSDDFTISAAYPVVASLLWAGSSLVTKHLTHSEAPDTLTLYLLVLLTPINAVLALESGFALSGAMALGLVGLAGLLTAAAQFGLAKAYSIADAAFLQPFDHLKLPFNIGLGFVVFGYAPEGSMWLGTLIIFAASAYLLDREMRGAHHAAAT